MVVTVESAKKAMLVLQRFGLGPKPGGISRIAADPIAALKREIASPGGALIRDTTLPTYKAAATRSQDGFVAAWEVQSAELRARILQHMKPEIGFLERLTMFWSNHFSMSINKTEVVRGTIGQMERDIIRPNILGNFGTMLKKVMTHPAMIAYLDNKDSIGPNSKIGREWGVGLNENLAREILELHTVGSGGGYTEKDVTQFARIITGWSYVRGWEADNGYNGGNASNRGQFIFRPDWHEPGPITVMGKSFAAGGLSQGLAVLDYLATHPRTAEHIAYKLVLHFITDKPTAAMVKPVATAFLASKGDLKATVLALLALPEAFTAPLSKMRTPFEIAVAQFRAMGKLYAKVDDWILIEPMRALNNVPWEHLTPDGFPDESFYWLNPDGMRIRVDTAFLVSWMLWGEQGAAVDQLAIQLFGPLLPSSLKAKLQAAGNPPEALTILFMSPEFQRR